MSVNNSFSTGDSHGNQPIQSSLHAGSDPSRDGQRPDHPAASSARPASAAASSSGFGERPPAPDAESGACPADVPSDAPAGRHVGGLKGLFEPVGLMQGLTDSVIVFYSGGKDSAVVLDLAFRRFKTVHVVFMYQVQGLSFQEATLRWAEKRYGCEIYRIPHFELSKMLRAGIFCKPDLSVRVVSISDVYAHVRGAFGLRWIVAGERCGDSTVRNAIIKASGPIDEKRGRFYPLAFWKKPDVMAYIKARGLKISPESALLGHSFRALDGKDLSIIKQHYPDDYAKILNVFPLVEVNIVREATKHADAQSSES